MRERLTPAVRQYLLVTGNYWAFTLTDGALRMLVVLHFHQRGYTPLQVAMLFLFYEIFGVVTNLVGGWLGARLGLNRTMNLGLVLQVGALAWWQCALGAAVLWVASMVQGWPAWGAPWAWLAGLGLIHPGLAYTLMYAGMARLATARVAVLQFAYPTVAIVVDWVYFQHTLDGWQMAGVVLMLGAIAAGERSARRNR